MMNKKNGGTFYSILYTFNSNNSLTLSRLKKY